MTQNLLVIFNRKLEDPVCELFLPYWQRSGCDLMCSSPLDAKSELAGVKHFHAGRELSPARVTWWWYQSRVLDTMKYCLTLDYQFYWLTQYDSVVLKPLPLLGLDEAMHHLAGGRAEPFKSSFFVHPPWGWGQNRLKEFVKAASTYDIKTTEFGIMDRFISLVMEEHKLEFTPCPFSWSMNSMDTPALVESARAALKTGKTFFHGIKDAKMLSELLVETAVQPASLT